MQRKFRTGLSMVLILILMAANSALVATAQGDDAATGLNNLALGKAITSSSEIWPANFVNDGIYTDVSEAWGYASLPGGPQWIQLDLGQSSDLSAIKVWRYYPDNRMYHDVIIQFSNDPTFQSGVTTVFNNDTDGSSGQGTGSDAEYAESSAGFTLPFSTVNARYVRLWSNGSTSNGWNHYAEIEVYGVGSSVAPPAPGPVVVPSTPVATPSLALHAPVVASSDTVQNPEYATDGNIDAAQYAGLDSGIQWAVLDLGSSFKLNQIKLWRYFADGRSYHDVIIQVSDDPQFMTGVTTVFNNDTDNSCLQGAGTDLEYAETADGRVFDFAAATGRYIKLWSNGSSSNGWNQIVEVEAYGQAVTPVAESDPADIALNATVSGSDDVLNPTLATDGYTLNSSAFASTGAGAEWMQIDLGANYNLEEIKLWHFYADARTYRDVIVQISGDPDFAVTCKTIFNNDTDNSSGQGIGSDQEYAETQAGKDIKFAASKGRYIRVWSNGSSINEFNHVVEVKAYGTKTVDDPWQLNNAALYKTVSSSTKLQNSALCVDGRIDKDKYTKLVDKGLQSLTVDLGQNYDLYKIKLWHYYNDKRMYNDVIIQVSSDPTFTQGVTTLFNNDSNNSAGQGIGADAVYAENGAGKELTFKTVTARYVRFWSNGSSVNEYNHYVEVQAYGTLSAVQPVPPTVKSLAYNTKVSGSATVTNPQYAVDGMVDSALFAGLPEGVQWLQIDLGKAQMIRRINLWHNVDARTFKDVIIQVSTDASFSKNVVTVFNNDSDNSVGLGEGTDAEYAESVNGKEISFGATKARYVRFYSNGSSVDTLNNYVEIRVFKTAPATVVKVPVLMYHSVRTGATGQYQVEASQFDAEMKYLKDNGFTALTMAQYIQIMKNGQGAPAKPVLITFDDGWQDNYTVAAPIMDKYGFKATFFIISNMIDIPDRVTTAQLKDLKKRGYDIGNHALNHERLTDYNYSEQMSILSQAKSKLETALGSKVISLSFPYGELNTDSITIVNLLGYQVSFSSYEGMSSSVDNTYTVRRLFVDGQLNSADFAELVNPSSGN